MRTIIATMLTLVCLMILCSASTAPAQEIKIGVVDMQEAMEKSEPGKKALSQLESEFKKLKSKLDKEKSELDKMRQEIQKQSLVLSQEAKIDKETEYKNKVRDFQDMYKSYKQKMQLKEKKLREPILDKMIDIIYEFGQENNFTMIVEKQNSGVVFHQEKIEITQQIIEHLNKTWQKNQGSQGNS